MKLHEAPSPNARRVHIFMSELGIECERVAVDIRAAENLSAEFLAKNPGGRVPVLELDDGTFIGESVAICRYLESIAPSTGAPKLFGDDGLAAAQIDMWQRRVEFNFLLELAGAFRNLTGVFKDRETCVKEWGEVCAERAPKALDMFDAQLGKSEYLAGDHFSIADITLGISLDFASMVKVFELPEPPNLTRWKTQMDARASFSAK
ncbi:glutathione S-transferase family protein [Pseudomonadales bacterium]|nr:glutathione S-transferase family protein [Pseudomonadales bacterium]